MSLKFLFAPSTAQTALRFLILGAGILLTLASLRPLLVFFLGAAALLAMPLTIAACVLFVVIIVSTVEDTSARLRWGVLACVPLCSFIAIVLAGTSMFELLSRLTHTGTGHGNLDPPVLCGFLVRYDLIYATVLGTALAYRLEHPQRRHLLLVTGIACAAFVFARWLPWF